MSRSARYSANERDRPTYRNRRPHNSSRPIASVTPTDENESWISIVPPTSTRAPQSRMSDRAGA